MVLRKLAGIFVCTLILVVASLASAGVPAPANCEASLNSGSGAVSLFNLPNGGGKAFDAAQVAGGAQVDATISLTVRDASNVAISGFAADLMWLASVDGGMVACVGGTIADVDTDANGVTRWANALGAGGHSTANCQVVINGDVVTGSLLPLHFNSADINGDGVVNVTDLQAFAGFYFGPLNFAADFMADGVYNLNDITRFGQGYGAACP